MPEAFFESEGPVAFLTFNRPSARNALTWAMYDTLTDACSRVEADDRVRVLVVRASGGSFAAGTDISQFTSFRSADDGLAYEARLDAVIDRLERIAVPTIAQVEGVAAGAGCVIAFACDLRVCTPDARFGVPIARTLGNTLSAANCARLTNVLGVARTKDILFTGRLLDAREADSLGLVTRLAEPARIAAIVADLARTIAANAPLSLRAMKETLRRLADDRLAGVSADDLIAQCYASTDFREGVEAFMAHRKPQFTGR